MTDDQNWQPPGGAPAPRPAYGEYSHVPVPPTDAAGGSGPGSQGQQPGAPYGAAPGWTPPPKPGLIPLRPLGFGTLIGAPFQVLRRNPRATFGSALIIQLVIVVASLVTVGGVSAFALTRVAMANAAERDTVLAGAIASIAISALVPIALGIVGSAFLQGVMVTEVARATLGEKLTMRSLWRLARRRLGSLTVWVLILAGVLIGVVLVLAGLVALLVISGPIGVAIGVVVGILGALGCLVLLAWLYTKTSLVPCLIVLERATIRASIARSWSLTTGHFWRTFGAQFLVAVIVNVVAQVVTTPLSLIYAFAVALVAPNGSVDANSGAIVTAVVSYVLLILLSVVIGAATSVVQASTVVLIYIDLRMRKEGLDLELVRFVEARETGSEVRDPYLPKTTLAGQSAAAGLRPE
ncbi:MAG TPA: hypothetical protein VGO31_15270 [Microbacteriaceae bacterium]|nr:hypothetical protein [Microbacteriaceae bacterium]